MKHCLSLLLVVASFFPGRAAAQQAGPSGSTVEHRFPPPAGYVRTPAAAGSFGAYLRKLPLKPPNSPVLLYDGRQKPNNRVYAAVLSMDIGKKDLQQCADAVMRLRAEYLFAAGKSQQIHFNLTNGLRLDFSKWAEGYRLSVQGSRTSWRRQAAPSASYQSLRAYLEQVFAYAGTLSLSRELKPVPIREMQAGDVLIRGGSPGHAVIVLDMAQNAQGEKVYLLAQSYMPAQDIQVLLNPAAAGASSPWYRLPKGPDVPIPTPEWDFSSSDLRRFAQD